MTGGLQEPFIYDSLGGATIALVPAPAKKIEVSPATVGIAPKAVPITAPSALAPQPVAVPPTPAPQPSNPCSRDEQRLAQLRAEPARDQIVKFQNELACARLRTESRRYPEIGARILLRAAATANAPLARERRPVKQPGRSSRPSLMQRPYLDAVGQADKLAT